MTGRFERSVLFAAGALVVGLVSVAVVNPPRTETAVPKAHLDRQADRVPASGVIQAKAVSGGAESLMRGVDVRVLDDGHKAVDLHTTAALSRTFQRIGYDLDGVREGAAVVPRLFLASLPADLAEVRQAKKRKAIFFKTVLPLILQVNDEIRADRRRLSALVERARAGHRLAAVDRLWLVVLAERYKVDRNNYRELLKRVDIVPVSMALAQAAEESGWGTSRFSREGNAIFGEWTFSDAKGLVPLRRDTGKSHRVRAFKSLLHSVRAYARNLNTHRAYRGFRTKRLDMRTDGVPLRGRPLIETLTRYSERGPAYVKGLHKIMTVNNLDRLDEARLREPDVAFRPLI